MKPFQLTVNGEVHMIDQDKFKASLVDCPKEVALKQLELGHGIMAVMSQAFERVLLPISVDVHKYIFVRTLTLSMKVAEISVLLGKKKKETDLFVIKDTRDDDIKAQLQEIEELKAKLADAKIEALKQPVEGIKIPIHTTEPVSIEPMEIVNNQANLPIEEVKEEPVADKESETDVSYTPLVDALINAKFVHDPEDEKEPEIDEDLTDTLLEEFIKVNKKPVTRTELLVMVSGLDEELEPEWLAKLNKADLLILYNDILDEQELSELPDVKEEIVGAE